MKKFKKEKSNCKLKKYWHYLLLFLAIFAIVYLLSDFGLQTNENKINVELKEDTRFSIEIEEAISLNTKGHIYLKVTNNTKELLENIYLKVQLFNNGEYVNTIYEEIKYLNVDEVNRLEIIFDEENITSASIEIDENYEPPKEKEETREKSEFQEMVTPEITEETMGIAEFIGLALGLYIIVP